MRRNLFFTAAVFVVIFAVFSTVNAKFADEESFDAIMKVLVETGVQKAQMTGDAKYLDYAKELN